MATSGNPSCRVTHFRLGDEALVVASFPAPSRELRGLTPAERSLLDGLLRGLTERELASARGRALATVRHQVESIYRKTGVRSRAELVAFCAQPGRTG